MTVTTQERRDRFVAGRAHRAEQGLPPKRVPDVAGDVPAFLRHPRRACAGASTEQFFLDSGPVPRKLRRMCDGCPVNVECLLWALAHEPWGVWAGTTERQRRQLRDRAHLRQLHGARGTR